MLSVIFRLSAEQNLLYSCCSAINVDSATNEITLQYRVKRNGLGLREFNGTQLQVDGPWYRGCSFNMEEFR